ncbi:hypothetical protein B0H14DRAFT_2555876 [Mycena olivaceomarginata]|nr:hypothetical protein B0H14DRAFT_2555876 [Mycena olivaceomarginata]
MPILPIYLPVGQRYQTPTWAPSNTNSATGRTDPREGVTAPERYILEQAQGCIHRKSLTTYPMWNIQPQDTCIEYHCGRASCESLRPREATPVNSRARYVRRTDLVVLMIIPVVWTGGATYHWWTCSEEGQAEDENSGMSITIHECLGGLKAVVILMHRGMNRIALDCNVCPQERSTNQNPRRAKRTRFRVDWRTTRPGFVSARRIADRIADAGLLLLFDGGSLAGGRFSEKHRVRMWARAPRARTERNDPQVRTRTEQNIASETAGCARRKGMHMCNGPLRAPPPGHRGWIQTELYSVDGKMPGQCQTITSKALVAGDRDLRSADFIISG